MYQESIFRTNQVKINFNVWLEKKLTHYETVAALGRNLSGWQIIIIFWQWTQHANNKTRGSRPCSCAADYNWFKESWKHYFTAKVNVTKNSVIILICIYGKHIVLYLTSGERIRNLYWWSAHCAYNSNCNLQDLKLSTHLQQEQC